MSTEYLDLPILSVDAAQLICEKLYNRDVNVWVDGSIQRALKNMEGYKPVMSDFYEKYEKIKKLPINTKDNPDNVRKYYAELSQKTPFFLYGAGTALLCLCEYYQDFGIHISGIADTYRRGRIFDHDILSPERLVSEYKNAFVLITSEKYEAAIQSLLLSMGFPKGQILPYMGAERRRLLNGPAACFEQKYLKGYQWAYDFFSDPISKNIVLEYIKMFWKGERLTKTTNSPQYFDEFILSEYECFVQAGCFQGDTVKEFIQKHTAAHDIYTFEADPQVYDIAKNNLKECENVQLISMGLWSTETSLTFSNVDKLGGTSFVMDGKTAISVPVVSLDSFFRDKPHIPTFIQFDIEGSEREALKGAEQIIRRYKPKLSICVYHLPDDIYVIPQLLHSFCPDYKMHLQQYNNRYSETVLYATV